MCRWIMATFVVSYLLATLGCAGFSEYRQQRTARRDNESRMGFVDANWRQGYGYNNPNNERLRQGLEPLNFDGSTGKRKTNFAGEYLGDLLGYGVKSTAKGIVDWIRR